MEIGTSETDFLKKNCPKNEENGPKIGFFECVKKFGS